MLGILNTVNQTAMCELSRMPVMGFTWSRSMMVNLYRGIAIVKIRH